MHTNKLVEKLNQHLNNEQNQSVHKELAQMIQSKNSPINRSNSSSDYSNSPSPSLPASSTSEDEKSNPIIQQTPSHGFVFNQSFSISICDLPVDLLQKRGI